MMGLGLRGGNEFSEELVEVEVEVEVEVDIKVLDEHARDYQRWYPSFSFLAVHVTSVTILCQYETA